MYRALYVDDEAGLLEIGKIFLENLGQFSIDTITSASGALPLLKQKDYDAIISDYQMPGMDGIAFLKEVRATHGDIPFILFTGRGREDVVIDAINNGADFYLQKGGDPKAQFAELAHKLRQAIRRKEAERSLFDSERRLTDIINFLPDATFVIDRAGRVIAWNRAIEEMTGIAAAEMVGKGDYEYALPFYGVRRKILINLIFEPDEVIAEQYAHIIHEKDTLIADTTLPRPKGRTATLMGKASPLYDRQGAIVGAIESIRDISGLKQAEDELRAAYGQIAATEETLRSQFDELATSTKDIRVSQARLQAFMESATDALSIWDASLRLVDLNQAALTYLLGGGRKEDVLGHSLEEFLTDAPERYRDVIQTGVPFISTQEVPWPGRGKRWLIIRIFKVGDGLGILTTDITSQKDSEDKLRAAYEQLTATEEELRAQYEETALSEARIKKSEAEIAGLFHAAPVGIGVVKDRVLLKVNERLCTMTGYSLQELEGRNTRFLYLNDEDYAAVGRMREEAYRQDTPESIEVRWKRKDGSVFDVSISAAATDRSDPAAPMVYSALDVTEKNREHAELVDAYRRVSVAEEELKSQYDELARSGEKIRASGAEIAGILRAAPVGIGVVAGRVLLRVNDRFCDITGYSRDEILGKNARFLYPDDDEFARAGNFYALDSSRDATSFLETRFLRKDGTVRDIRLFGTMIDPEHPGAGTIFTVLDITGEKRAREELRAAYEKVALSEEELRNQFEELARSEQEVRKSENAIAGIFHAAPVGIAVVADRTLLRVNEHLCSITGYTREELEGRNTRFIYADEGEYARVAEFYASGNGGTSIETRFLRKDGTVRDIQIFGTRIDPEHPAAGMIFTALDITGRKMSENALKESEEKYRTLVERANEAITIIQDGRRVYANPRMADLVGIPVQDLLGISFLDTVWPDDRDMVQARHRERSAGRDVPEVYEFRMIGPGGRLVWVHISIAKILWQGRPATLNLLTDITELKVAEATLAENQQRMLRVLEKEPLAAAFVNNDGKVIFINERFRQVFGYTMEDIPTLDAWWPLAYPDPEYRERARETWTAALRQSAESRKEIAPEEYTITTKSGEERIAETFGIAFDDGFLATFIDITERRKAEEALRASEEKFRAIVENIQDMVYQADMEGRFVMASPFGARMLGYNSPDQLIGRPVSDVYADPNDRKAFLDALSREGSVYGYPLALKSRDGTIFNVVASSHFTYDAHGEVQGVEGILHDITGLRRAEDALRASEERYRIIAENMADQITQIDRNRTIIYSSPSVGRQIGYAPEEYLGTDAAGYIHLEDRERVLKAVREAIARHAPSIRLEFRYRHKNGTYHWYESGTRLLYDPDGKYDGAIFAAREITRRKKVEDALQKSEERLDLAMEVTNDGIFDWNLLKGTAYFSPRYITMLGYGENELTPSFWTWEGLLHPDDRDRAIRVVDEYRTGKRESHAIEFRLQAKDGSWRWILSKAKLHGRTADGAPIRMVGTHTDITDRKNAEEELRRSEMKYRHILENMQDAYFQTDMAGTVIMANPSAARLYGYDSARDMVGIPAASLYGIPGQREELLQKLRAAGRITDFTGNGRRKDGSTFGVSLNIQFQFDESGRILGTEAIVRDITERRMMEHAVTESNRKLNLLNAITRHDIVNQVAILNGYAKLAKMKSTDPAVDDFLSKIDAAGAAIEHQIDFTKMYQELGVQAPCWQSLDDLVSRTRHPGIRFISGCHGIEIFADPMLEKVFSNLLDNSVRHGMHVTVISASCRKGENNLTLLWEDNGIGIPETEKEKIFERGYGKHTGLGLFLAREILDITGITIIETGEPGRGARFEITMPDGAWRSTGKKN